MDHLISTFPKRHGYLRLVVTRGTGPMGLDPSACRQPNVTIIATQLEMIDPERRHHGIRLITASTRRLPADGLDARIKSLNYLNHILARMEAIQAGAQEAILLNHQGRIAEGSVENLFIVRNNQITTPRPVDGALAGITRSVILQLAAAQNIPATQAPLTTYDLYTADECFLTGTGAELVPVREVDGRPLRYCPGPMFSALAKAFQERIKECKPIKALA